MFLNIYEHIRLLASSSSTSFPLNLYCLIGNCVSLYSGPDKGALFEEEEGVFPLNILNCIVEQQITNIFPNV